MANRHGSSVVVDEHDFKVTSIFSRLHEHAVLEDDATSDERTLGALGYRQEFKRDFSIWESFSVSFAVLGLLPSVASTITYSLGYAGLGGSVWGWLIAATMIQATALSMAELCSSMPTAGASMLVTCGQIANPDYEPQNWQIYLILVGLCVMQGFVCMQSTKFIGRVNVIGTIWNMAVVIIFLIWFPVGSINRPKTNDSHTVWTTFTNGTDWPIGWAVIMSFLTTLYTLAGYDTPFHLSEECSNANIASPRAIVMTAQLGLYLGWAIILVIVYTVQDIPAVIGSSSQPFGTLCVQVLGRRAGLAMFALNITAQYFVGQGVTITASRVIFAYSRDGALIGSRWWSYVHPRTKTPVFATWGVLSVSILVGLLLFGGPITINAVFTMVVIGQYTAFTFPVALKLFFGRGRFRPGPWHLGRWSTPINAVAVAWWMLIVPALVFPSVKGKDLTPQTMNWTCLMYGGVMLLAMTYYAVSARKWFTGPRVNVAHIDGRNPDSHTSDVRPAHVDDKQN